MIIKNCIKYAAGDYHKLEIYHSDFVTGLVVPYITQGKFEYNMPKRIDIQPDVTPVIFDRFKFIVDDDIDTDKILLLKNVKNCKCGYDRFTIDARYIMQTGYFSVEYYHLAQIYCNKCKTNFSRQIRSLNEYFTLERLIDGAIDNNRNWGWDYEFKKQ